MTTVPCMAWGSCEAGVKCVLPSKPVVTWMPGPRLFWLPGFRPRLLVGIASLLIIEVEPLVEVATSPIGSFTEVDPQVS